MRTDFGPFLAWCQSKGVTTPLQLVSDGNYRYMALPQDRDQLFSQSKSPDLLNVVTAPLEACIVGDDWETLVEKLIFEKSKGTQSDYSPWLDQFPTLEDFQGMPRFWSSDRLEFVSQYDSGQLQARMDIDRLRFNQVDDPWALAIVDSRSNFLPDNTYAMTPMLDMLNHKSGVKTSARLDGGNRLLLEVDKNSILQPSVSDGNDWGAKLLGMFGGGRGDESKETTKGGEVFVSYGNFDNMETLCNYGFVEEDNVSNVETFRVRLMGKGPAYLVVEQDGKIDTMFNRASLAEFRLALATSEELERLEKNDWDGIEPISEKNDIEVFALIAGELEEALYDAKIGANEAGNAEKPDELVASYLRGRQRTLEKGRDALKAKYPQIF